MNKSSHPVSITQVEDLSERNRRLRAEIKRVREALEQASNVNVAVYRELSDALPSPPRSDDRSPH